jgi:lysophospholipase L1-like esterase
MLIAMSAGPIFPHLILLFRKQASMRHLLLCLSFAASFILGSSQLLAQSAPRDEPKILAIGDSLMAWHLVSKNSVADAAAKTLGEPVQSRAMGGAKIIHSLPLTGALGMKISRQFQDKSWDWVIMTGGGNDLFLGCGCGNCDRRMMRMIAPNGAAGEIPSLVSKIRNTGAKVVYIGYLRSPGVDSVIDECRAHGDELEERLANMAKRDSGVYFVPLDDMVGEGDRSMHGADMIHPSRKASALIGARVANVIQRADKSR